MSRRGLVVIVALQWLALVAVAAIVGDNGWDDGAITVAFARTFARDGLIALTPRSEVVEGFSSVSWFLLNGAAALARPGYGAAIFVSQVLAATSVAASTWLLGRACLRMNLDRLFSTLVVIAFVAWGCSFSEVSNGMEMGLLAFAVLLIASELLTLRPRAVALVAGVVLAVTTRFEAIAYVGLLALVAARIHGRRAFWTIALAAAGTVALLTLWRVVTFGDFLPNTYWAKRWPPYADFGPSGRLLGAVEGLRFFVAPLVLLALARARRFDLASVVRAERRAVLVLGAPIVGAIMVGALIGKAWGYVGRMPYFASPFMFLLLAVLLGPWLRAKRSRLRTGAVVAAFVIPVLMSKTGAPSGPLDAALHGGSFGVSPRSYAASGRVFRRFLDAAGLPQPAIMTPDLGGLALTSPDLRLIDLGLLSNRVLAHRGPAAVADVVKAEAPSIIEAHWEWATAGHLYELPAFNEGYVPAFGGGTKLWLRRDVADAIETRRRGCRAVASRADVQAALRAHRYADHDLPSDRKAFDASGIVFLLDEAEPGLATPCPRAPAAP